MKRRKVRRADEKKIFNMRLEISRHTIKGLRDKRQEMNFNETERYQQIYKILSIREDISFSLFALFTA